MVKSLSVGIVGGSIAGCSAAILMSRAGHEVTIFERSKSKLQGRGGGIATPTATFQSLVADDIIDVDFPHTVARQMPFIGRRSSDDLLGRTAWTLPTDLACFHWGNLWENLRARVADRIYLTGERVIGARKGRNHRVTLEMEGGSSTEFDLVLFADGYRSLGRHLLQPATELRYRGYILWRGLLPEASLQDSRPLEDAMPRLSYADLAGHLVIYLVPGLDGSTTKGERLCNWAAYLPIAEKDLPEVMIDRFGESHVGSLPPGAMRRETELRFQDLMAANLPKYFAEILSKTTDTHIQAIYTADVDRYAQDRIALLGDAGGVIQPFTISGVFKGFHNANDLVAALHGHDHVDEALSNWSDAQTKRSRQILGLGERMEQAFIWNPLDFATADAGTTEQWWRSSIGVDNQFTYEDKR